MTPSSHRAENERTERVTATEMYDRLLHNRATSKQYVEVLMREVREEREQKRCGGTRTVSEHHDDSRGPEFNNEPDSTAGGGIHSCPGCPDCDPVQSDAERYREALERIESSRHQGRHTLRQMARQALDPAPQDNPL